MLLAGDIGGTKTKLAVFSREAGLHTPIAQEKYASDDYADFESMARVFLKDFNISVDDIDIARIGVAGPVVAGRAKVTNLPWVVAEDRLERALELKSVKLLNDLEAIANGVPLLETDDLHTINAGTAFPDGAIAVIAPGTGLGEGYLTWDGQQYRGHSSEGGHTDFGPRNALEMDMLQYLQGRFGRVSYERICSGIGIPNIYDFLRDEGYADEPAWLAKQLTDSDDRTPIIVSAAQDKSRPCSIGEKTLEVFISVLGSEAGNLALKVLSTGGVYLGGGIPPRMLDELTSSTFMDAFLDKGRMSELLVKMPVHVILHPDVGLLGAAHHGFGGF